MSYVERGAPVPAAGISPRLTAARAAVSEIPPPDFAIEDPLPEGDSQSEQHDWASEGVQNAEDDPVRRPRTPSSTRSRNCRASRTWWSSSRKRGCSRITATPATRTIAPSYAARSKRASNYASKLSGTLNDANTVASYVRAAGHPAIERTGPRPVHRGRPIPAGPRDLQRQPGRRAMAARPPERLLLRLTAADRARPAAARPGHHQAAAMKPFLLLSVRADDAAADK